MVKMMMAKAGIRGYFTHHFLRATAVSRLIRGVTGHRSEGLQSLKIYLFAVQTFLTCSQRLSCGGTREVRSDVSL